MANSAGILGRNNVLFGVTVVFLLSQIGMLGQSVYGEVAGHNAEIVKRQLRWNRNKYIVSDKSSGANLRIDYLQPHSKNVPVLDNRDYMAFTLYTRNGAAEVANTGVFHFIGSDIAGQHRTRCSRPTMHAGAYHYFYNTCPENENNIVASGYCYQGLNGRGLVYNSYTFNSGGMTYLDGQYYLDGNRVVNAYEQNLIRHCFNSWKNGGFKVTSWRCPTVGIPLAGRLIGDSGSPGSKSSTGQCDECECLDVGGSPRVLQSNVIVLMASSYILFHLLSEWHNESIIWIPYLS